jgi:hypothetical protein
MSTRCVNENQRLESFAADYSGRLVTAAIHPRTEDRRLTSVLLHKRLPGAQTSELDYIQKH